MSGFQRWRLPHGDRRNPPADRRKYRIPHTIEKRIRGRLSTGPRRNVGIDEVHPRRRIFQIFKECMNQDPPTKSDTPMPGDDTDSGVQDRIAIIESGTHSILCEGLWIPKVYGPRRINTVYGVIFLYPLMSS